MAPIRPKTALHRSSTPQQTETPNASTSSSHSSAAHPYLVPVTSQGQQDGSDDGAASQLGARIPSMVINGGYNSFNHSAHIHDKQRDRTVPPRPDSNIFGPNSRIMIRGGQPQFMPNRTHYHRSKVDGIQKLYRRSAPAAAFNSKERYEPPKCHENTRVGLLKIMWNWANDGPTQIMWLYGSAGAGKSAVAQTTCMELHMASKLAASFFFSRTARANGHRGHEGRFVTTIAYQLLQVMPALREYIDAVIYHNPSICDRTLSEQVMALIIEPLRNLINDQGDKVNLASCPRVIVVDGLDECNKENGQVQVLEAIVTLVGHPDVFPFSVFLASRPEVGISNWINDAEARFPALIRKVYLLDECDNDHDIEIFVNAEAADIKGSHPFRAKIPPNWPARPHVKLIVKRAAGQFVYAATIMKYVKDIQGYPHVRLDVILSHATVGNDQPYAELDALYLWILRQSKHPKHVHRLLAFRLTTITFSGPLYGVDSNDYIQTLLSLPYPVDATLIDLQSIMNCDVDGMGFWDEDGTRTHLIDRNNKAPTVFGVHVPSVFYHASLVEFLLNPGRSAEFYVNVRQFDMELWDIALERVIDYTNTADEEYIIYCFLVLIQTRQARYPHNMDRICAELKKWDTIHTSMLYDLLQRLSSKAFSTGRFDKVEGTHPKLLRVFGPAIARKQAQIMQDLEHARLPRELFILHEHLILVGDENYSNLEETDSPEHLMIWHMFADIQRRTGGDAWSNFTKSAPRSFQRYLAIDWRKYVNILETKLNQEEQDALLLSDLWDHTCKETLATALFWVRHIILLLDPSEEASKPAEVRAVFRNLERTRGNNWRAIIAAWLLSNKSADFIWGGVRISDSLIAALDELAEKLFPPDAVLALEKAAFPFDFPCPEVQEQFNEVCSIKTSCALPRWCYFPSKEDSESYVAGRNNLGKIHDYVRLGRLQIRVGGKLDGMEVDAEDGFGEHDSGNEMEEDEEIGSDEYSDGEDMDDDDDDDVHLYQDSDGPYWEDTARDLSSETIDPETGKVIDFDSWSLGFRIRNLIDKYEAAEKAYKRNNA